MGACRRLIFQKIQEKNMLSEVEIKVLQLLNSSLLAKRGEIHTFIGNGPDGVNNAIQKLISMDFIKSVEPIGEKCFVITRKGSRTLKAATNPEKRADREFSFY